MHAGFGSSVGAAARARRGLWCRVPPPRPHRHHPMTGTALQPLRLAAGTNRDTFCRPPTSAPPTPPPSKHLPPPCASTSEHTAGRFSQGCALRRRSICYRAWPARSRTMSQKPQLGALLSRRSITRAGTAGVPHTHGWGPAPRRRPNESPAADRRRRAAQPRDGIRAASYTQAQPGTRRHPLAWNWRSSSSSWSSHGAPHCRQPVAEGRLSLVSS